MLIAVLENDPDQTALITQTLTAAGHACKSFVNAQECLASLPENGAGLLVLGGLPATDDTAFVHAARQQLPGIPILLIAARNPPERIAAAIAAGVDDYLLTPLRRSELHARVAVQIERAHPGQTAREEIRFDAYRFEPAAGRITLAGQSVDVTRKEFNLALLFFRNLGHPLSRATIRETVWGANAELPSRTIDTHVSRVRSKLGLHPENGFRLTPVYSYGYQLERFPA